MSLVKLCRSFGVLKILVGLALFCTIPDITACDEGSQADRDVTQGTFFTLYPTIVTLIGISWIGRARRLERAAELTGRQPLLGGAGSYPGAGRERATAAQQEVLVAQAVVVEPGQNSDTVVAQAVPVGPRQCASCSSPMGVGMKFCSQCGQGQPLAMAEPAGPERV
jgi:hypothetical protein